MCKSFVELLDLYPTLASLCALPAQPRLQGKDISPMLQDPKHEVRTTAFSVAPARKGFLLRDDQWAYIQYGEDAKRGIELFDMEADPNQFTNLATKPAHQKTVTQFKTRLATKLKSLRDNDLRRQK